MRSRAGVALWVAAAIAGVYALDVFLARVESAESRRDARSHFEKGRALLAAGQPSEAAAQFRRASVEQRRNGEYQVALADALNRAGKRDEARLVVDSALRERPDDARANLLAARLAGSAAEAVSYFHRAIYGTWEGQSRRVEARLELIGLLKKQGERKQLLAELLPIEAETQDRAVLARVAADYVEAGSPARAAEAYRNLLAADRDNPDLLFGLGYAELALGRYRPAQAAFAQAFRAQPANSAVRHGLELASELSALDPTLRRLSPIEKYRRSERLLMLAAEAACAPAPQRETRPRMTNETAESRLEAAQRIWRERDPACQGSQSDLVGLMMRKLGE